MRQKGKTSAELSRAIEVPVKTIGDWLTGRVPRDLDGVRRAALYFGVPVHYLLFGEEDAKNAVADFLEKSEIHTGIYEISIKKVIPKK
jgi:transcriptional regulator with XRE-family HTH domain